MIEAIPNKVELSGIITLDLAEFYPEGKRIIFDMKDFLYNGLMLKEKIFRDEISKTPFEKFRDGYIAVMCSEDAIIPAWAYMLVITYLQPVAKKIVCGNMEQLEAVLWHEAIGTINPENYRDKRVVVKGCTDAVNVPVFAYAAVTALLLPVAKSIMYGEPCSTVPVFKRTGTA